MKNNKQVLNYCKNFEKIVNTDFVEGDNLSLQLVKIYKDYIFKKTNKPVNIYLYSIEKDIIKKL